MSKGIFMRTKNQYALALLAFFCANTHRCPPQKPSEGLLFIFLAILLRQLKISYEYYEDDLWLKKKLGI